MIIDCYVLILKVPTTRYKPEEVAVVRDFVDNGGGLLLIGEHTDYNGGFVLPMAIERRTLLAAAAAHSHIVEPEHVRLAATELF